MEGINIAGILFQAMVQLIPSKRPLFIPHYFVPDVSFINFEEAKSEGVRGVAYDVDATLTKPKANPIQFYNERIATAVETSIDIFGRDNVLIISNRAGSRDDSGYVAAKRIQDALGVEVLIHSTWKKPHKLKPFLERVPTQEDRRRWMMVGDRPTTDIGCGNNNEMLTFLCDRLTTDGEKSQNSKLREGEINQIKQYLSKGISAPYHPLANLPNLCYVDLLQGDPGLLEERIFSYRPHK